ncbi:MAG: dihydropteroate synthase [Nitrosomonas sp.]|jgi:dihydropteroate synthase|nr:dihydropteroate synthase [Nitrosomonas sp.]
MNNRLQRLLAEKHQLIMGIVNVTPDSFSDGGCYATISQAKTHISQLIAEGADVLDIGGESTRPGSKPVSVNEELDRVMPVIEYAINQNALVSVDTTKPEVMQASIQAGISLVNDINALQTPGALEVVAASEVMVCLMHKQGQPDTMQDAPEYSDVINEVGAFLRQRAAAAALAGITATRIIIDPGFGFGKTLKHNLILLRQLDQFLSMNFPVLVGISRKSMLGAITGNAVDNRKYASIAAALIAADKGARILRVHDVKATRDALAVLEAVNSVGAM